MIMNLNNNDITQRKIEHLIISLKHDEYLPKGVTTLFEDVYLVHNALPEIDYNEIDTKVNFLGYELSAPLIVEGMTGGFDLAEKINRIIAKVVEELGIGMGIGSQRVALENPSLIKTYKVVREVAPNAFIIGNIGAVQIKEYKVSDIEKLVNMIKANALAIHLNPLQECIQPEGEPLFKNVSEKIREIVKALDIPVIIKEVGCGISKEVAIRLTKLGIHAIDVAGLGGTSFALIEAIRSKLSGNDEKYLIGKTFMKWGIPTVISIIEVRSVTNLPIIASGGIRTGLDIAKSIALGADIAGIGLPILKEAVTKGEKGVRNFLKRVIEELRVTMFLTGSKCIDELKRKPVVLSDRVINWLKQRGVDYSYLFKNRI